MRSEVLVSLLISGVLGDEVEVFSADDECAVHLGGNDGAGQDTATNGHKASEWALLIYLESKSAFYTSSKMHAPDGPRKVSSFPQPFHPSTSWSFRYRNRSNILKVPHTDVGTLNGGLWCAESQSNVLVPSSSSLANSAGLRLRLGVQEDVRLLLESALRLHSQFGGHDCGFRGLSKVASRGGSWRFWRKSLLLLDFSVALSSLRVCGSCDISLS